MSDAVTDTFTGADNTVVSTGHTGETGASWTINPSFGPGVDNEFIIRSNSLARPIWPAASNSGDALIYPSGTLPGGTAHFIIEFEMVWDADTDSTYMVVYEKADVAGNPEDMCELISHSLAVATGWGGISTFGTATDRTTVFAPTTGQTYLIQLEVNGTALSIKVDGVLKKSWTRSAMPVEPFGLDFYEPSGAGEMRVPSLRVYPVGPPPAFWTDSVRATEVDA